MRLNCAYEHTSCRSDHRELFSTPSFPASSFAFSAQLRILCAKISTKLTEHRATHLRTVHNQVETNGLASCLHLTFHAEESYCDRKDPTVNTLNFNAIHTPPYMPWSKPSFAITDSDQKRVPEDDGVRTSKECDRPSISEDFALASRARRCLEQHHHFHGRTSSIDIVGDANRLVVTGKLPSYYLKQLLQETLMRMEGVGAIENCVDVVNSEGVSSSPAAKPNAASRT